MSKIDQSKLDVFWSETYFPALDGLRALSILLVVSFHVGGPNIRGWVGVHIFFVLSGFLITTLLLRERERYGRISLRAFYTRRFFRIVPIYYIVLCAYVPVVLLMHDSLRWTELKLALPYLLTFMQEYRPAASGMVFGQAWTLGIEEKFYLLSPLLIIVAFPFKRLSIIIVLSLCTVWFLIPDAIVANYGSLLMGSFLAIVLAKSTTSFFRQFLLRIPTSLAALLALAVYVVFWYHSNLFLMFSASITMLIGTLVLNASWLRSILEHPWIVIVGKRSYAMYLIHVLVMHTVEKFAGILHVNNWYTVVPVVYLVSFAGATILFYLVERPCLAYGRRLSKRLRGEAVWEPLTTASAQSSALKPVPLEKSVAVIEREYPRVPNAFENDTSESNEKNAFCLVSASNQEKDK
jgi:peptidoglycan/LPS O-acetylase OafA/YrhL